MDPPAPPSNHADDSPFTQALDRFKVPADLQQLLISEDFDLGSFGMIAVSLTSLDSILEQFAEDLGRALERRESAAVRQLWVFCQPCASSSIDASQPAASAPGPPQSNGWCETFPPKLSSDSLRQLKLDYESAYPSEILDSHSLPGPRMMALTSSQLSKREWKWVPWSLRLSQHQHDAHTSQRPKKMAKLETLSVQDLILDDVPSRELPAQLGIGQLTQILTLQAVAIALCKGAHLHVLKSYVAKFVRLATHRYEPDSNLRSPNTAEMQAADHEIWNKIADLYNLRSWTLDDAIYELTEVRGDIEALLQPRPQQKQVSMSVAPKGKGKGTKGKSKGKYKGQSPPKQQWLTKMYQDGKDHTLCLRYNQGLCHDPNCRYTHACCVAVGNMPCGKLHAAIHHNSVPH